MKCNPILHSPEGLHMLLCITPIQLCYFRDCFLTAMSLKFHLYGFLCYAILKQNFKL